MKRYLSHFLFAHLRTNRAFNARVLSKIETSVAALEQNNAAEVVFAIESCLSPLELISNTSPRSAAEAAFSRLRVWDTEQNTGILVYVLFADRAIEIVSDRGTHSSISSAVLEQLCKEASLRFRSGHFAEGACELITKLGELVGRCKIDAQQTNPNELPNRPVILR